MGLTAFVSGATGFVGSHLVRELYLQGWSVHVLARPTASLEDIEGIPVIVHHGDITDRFSLKNVIPEKPDAVFHVAASTNFWSKRNAEQDRVNIDGTCNMIEAASEAGAGRFIHTSSFTTWGFQNTKLNEDSPRTDKTDWINYVRSKHLAELAVSAATAEHRIDGVILNPAHILGPGDRHNWSRMLRMVHRRKMWAAPGGGGNFSDVREVARAHIQAFHKGRSGEKYLLGGEYASFLDVVRVAGEVLNRRPPVKAAPAWMMNVWAHLNVTVAAVSGREPDISPESAAMVSYSVDCESEKAQRELNYQFTPIRVLIEDTAEWMNRKGLL